MIEVAPVSADLPRAGPEAAGQIGVVREHGVLLAIVGAYAALGFAVDLVGVVPGLMHNFWYAWSYLLYLVVAAYSLAALLLYSRLSVRAADGRRIPGKAGWRAGWHRFRACFLEPRRFAGFAIACLAIPLVMNTFGSWKASLPYIHPFALDPALSRLDAAVHFGRLPWEWLQPLVGHPLVTRVLDLVYYTWLPVLTVVVIWQAWTPRRALRARFLVSFALSWCLLGSLTAIVLSSAGPCYYEAVTGSSSPYAPLMSYLHRVSADHPLTALAVQQALWTDYLNGTAIPFTGISAMPSLHVAMPALFTLTAWRVDRRVGWAFAAFTLTILIGSVHLGWHYAVDGYVSVAAVAGIWWVSGKLVQRYGGFTREALSTGR